MRNPITVRLPYSANLARMKTGDPLVGVVSGLRPVEISCDPSLQAVLSEDILSEQDLETEIFGDLDHGPNGLVLNAAGLAA